MTEETTIWADILKGFAVSATLTASAWGALGGATAALVIEVDRKAVMRQIALGGMVAAGVGALAMALVVAIWKLPPELIPAGAGAGGAQFMIGVFGPALIERLLRRIKGQPLKAEQPSEQQETEETPR